MMAFPFLNFFRAVLTQKVASASIFREETVKMENEARVYFERNGFGGLLYDARLSQPQREQTVFKIAGAIERATLSWPADGIKKILLTYRVK